VPYKIIYYRSHFVKALALTKSLIVGLRPARSHIKPFGFDITKPIQTFQVCIAVAILAQYICPELFDSTKFL